MSNKMGVPRRRESEDERHLVQQCALRDWDCWKLTVPNRRGVPDRLVIADKGIVAFVEVKRRVASKLSPLQARALDRIRSKGVLAAVLYGREAVDRYIEYLEECVRKAQ